MLATRLLMMLYIALGAQTEKTGNEIKDRIIKVLSKKNNKIMC